MQHKRVACAKEAAPMQHEKRAAHAKTAVPNSTKGGGEGCMCQVATRENGEEKRN